MGSKSEADPDQSKKSAPEEPGPGTEIIPKPIMGSKSKADPDQSKKSAPEEPEPRNKIIPKPVMESKSKADPNPSKEIKATPINTAPAAKEKERSSQKKSNTSSPNTRKRWV